MSANLSAVPKLQFFDNNGNPLVGGKLYTYAAGTTTPLATYTDSTGVTPNTNPIILDSRGEANVWLDATQYKFELKTSADALIWTVDNISNALNLSQLLASSGSAASPPYTFAADTTTGMYLAAVGQLGLTVGGVPVIRSTSTILTIGQSGGANDVDVTHFGDTTQTGNWTLTGDVNVTGAAVFNEAGADKDFRVEGDTDANLLFVDASTDRVGIGTSSPNEKFVVAGNASVDIYKLRGNTSAPSSTDAFIYRPANNTLGFGTTSAERMRIDSSGNVGIGTTTPQGKFVVSNNGAAGLEITPDGLASNPILVSYNRSTSAYGQLSFDSDFVVFRTNGTTEQARITSAGLLQFNSGYGSVATAFGCRAWVNFNGTGTPAARASGNVSSIADNGTGEYTVNFTSAMPDANYSVVCSAGAGDSAVDEYVAFTPSAFVLAGSVKVRVSSGAGADTDVAVISVAIFR
jgi:hypothetical protein